MGSKIERRLRTEHLHRLSSSALRSLSAVLLVTVSVGVPSSVAQETKQFFRLGINTLPALTDPDSSDGPDNSGSAIVYTPESEYLIASSGPPDWSWGFTDTDIALPFSATLHPFPASLTAGGTAEICIDVSGGVSPYDVSFEVMGLVVGMNHILSSTSFNGTSASSAPFEHHATVEAGTHCLELRAFDEFAGGMVGVSDGDLALDISVSDHASVKTSNAGFGGYLNFEMPENPERSFPLTWGENGVDHGLRTHLVHPTSQLQSWWSPEMRFRVGSFQGSP